MNLIDVPMLGGTRRVDFDSISLHDLNALHRRMNFMQDEAMRVSKYIVNEYTRRKLSSAEMLKMIDDAESKPMCDNT